MQAIDYKKYDVDLFIHSHHGELMRFIPEEVNLLEEIPAYSMIEKSVKEVLEKGFFLIASARIIAKKKIAWMHTDYSFVDVNPKIELPIWSEYDNIVSISPDVSKTFISFFSFFKR